MPRITKANSADILQKYLEDHGIKKKYLAKKLGISASTLSAYLHGSIKFTADFALNVAKVLGVSPSLFLDKSYKI
jgi:addiction module HigA family antidote